MSNYAVLHAGPVEGWKAHTFTIPGLGFARPGMQFIGDRLGLSGAEVSLNVFVPGQCTPLHHRHKRNEELYLFLSGRGEMLLDGEVVPVGEGSCVRVSPSVARGWRNTGDGDMVFVVIQYLQGSAVANGIADGLPAPDCPDWPG